MAPHYSSSPTAPNEVWIHPKNTLPPRLLAIDMGKNKPSWSATLKIAFFGGSLRSFELVRAQLSLLRFIGKAFVSWISRRCETS